METRGMARAIVVRQAGIPIVQGIGKTEALAWADARRSVGHPSMLEGAVAVDATRRALAAWPRGSVRIWLGMVDLDTGSDPSARTYTVRDQKERVVATGVNADEVPDAASTVPHGDAFIHDDADGTIVVAGMDGAEATLVALEGLLGDYERTKPTSTFRLRARLVGDQEAWTLEGFDDGHGIAFEGVVRDEGEAPVDGPDVGHVWSEVFRVTAPSFADARARLIGEVVGSHAVSLAGRDAEAAITLEPPKTFTVKRTDGSDEVLASRVSVEQARAAHDRASGHAVILDDATGDIACSYDLGEMGCERCDGDGRCPRPEPGTRKRTDEPAPR